MYRVLSEKMLLLYRFSSLNFFYDLSTPSFLSLGQCVVFFCAFFRNGPVVFLPSFSSAFFVFFWRWIFFLLFSFPFVPRRTTLSPNATYARHFFSISLFLDRCLSFSVLLRTELLPGKNSPEVMFILPPFPAVRCPPSVREIDLQGFLL